MTYELVTTSKLITAASILLMYIKRKKSIQGTESVLAVCRSKNSADLHPSVCSPQISGQASLVTEIALKLQREQSSARTLL